MKKLLLLAIIITSANQLLQAQQPAIHGTVAAKDKSPLKAATVSLLQAKDSALVKIAVSNEAGRYEFDKAVAGAYLVQVSHIGYATVFSPVFELDGAAVAVPALTLEKATVAAGAVTVTARKPFIEQRAGKTVMNVESSIMASGNSVMELIEKAPGVTVDKDENISIKGRKGVIVMIDGKPQQLSSADLANMLRNMQASGVEQVEIITQASSKYDAEGNSGMINIKTKKLKKAGFNGSFNGTLAQGYNTRYSLGTNVNYRKNKVNIFGNYNYTHRKNAEKFELQRDVNYNGDHTYFDQRSFNPDQRNSHSGKLGLDYSIDKRNTIGFMVDGYSARGLDLLNFSSTKIGSSPTQIDSSIEVNTNKYMRTRNVALNFNYRHVFDSTGRELTADFDRSFYKRDADEYMDNFYYMGIDKNLPRRQPWFLRNHALSDINITAAKMDYVHPLKHDAKIEAGIKYSYVTGDNDLQFDTLHNNAWRPDNNRSNHFIYKENVNAAYVNYSRQFKKLELMAGLRAEQTITEGNSVTLNSVVKRNYIQLFPSMFLSWHVTEKHQLSLAYSRRIDRPNYESLNPFVYFLDQYTYQQGNPYLRPSISDNIEIGHTFNQFLSTTIGWQHIKDPSITVTEQNDSTKVTYAINRNLNSQTAWSLGINAGFPVTKWWNTNANVQAFYLGFKYTDNGNNLDAGQLAMQYNMNNSLSFKKGWSGEVNFFYQTPLQYGIFKLKAQWNLGMGIKKDVMQKKATIRLSVDDLFNMTVNRISTTYQNMNIRLVENDYNTVARLTFTYRFGKNDNNTRRRSGSASDEKNRLGIGGGSR